MSAIQELGLRVRAATDGLPLPAIAQAVERLRRASEIFSWVRAASERSGGVPEVWPATERLEQATAALRAARDDIDAYLATIGLGPRTPAPPVDPPARDSSWVRRIDALTDLTPDDHPAGEAGADSSADLLDRVEHLGGDREGLRRELACAGPKVGFGLATVTPKRIATLAETLLGRPPEPADLPLLVDACTARVRQQLPGVDPALPGALLARACHLGAPVPRPAPPADSAVAGAVVAAALRDAARPDRVGRGADG